MSVRMDWDCRETKANDREKNLVIIIIITLGLQTPISAVPLEMKRGEKLVLLVNFLEKAFARVFMLVRQLK